MDIGKISFVGVKTEFEAIPAGVYLSEFYDYKVGVTGQQSKSPGAPKVDAQFSIVEDGDYKNRRLWRTLTFTPESLWAFKRTAVALGADVDWEDPEGFDPEVVLKSVMKAKCYLKVSVEKYEDPQSGEEKERNRIDDVQPLESVSASDTEPTTNGRKR